MKLSEHFTLEELISSDTAKAKGIDNTPTVEAAANLAILANKVLEPARVAFCRPIIISSGYRCEELNAAVKGAKNSQHKYGLAADLQVSPISGLRTLFDILKGMDVDQLLYEHNSQGKKWIHVSYTVDANRHYVNDNYNG